MNHTLTTEQLFALDKGETTVRELFPDLFQMKVGGYYGIKKHRFVFCVTELLDNGQPIGFGFAENLLINDSIPWAFTSDKVESLIHEELSKFGQMMCDEAVERGYKERVRIKCLVTDDTPTILTGQYFYNFETHELWFGGACIFKNGIWSEILT